MPRLLVTAVVRDPISAPRRNTSTEISTHGASTTAKFLPENGTVAVSLHDRLYADWKERDWLKLAATARAHLTTSAPLPQLHPITEAAVAFFRPQTSAVQSGDTERFIDSFPEAELNSYLAQELERDRSRLADDALALQCLGMLGDAKYDYVAALRSVETVSLIGKLWQCGRGKSHISSALVESLGRVDVALPSWSFEIDICRTKGSGSEWPETSPTERHIAQQARRDAQGGGASCDCTPPADECMPQDPCCGQVRYYVADLLELRDWPHRYKAGDLAYIENVAAGETRSREHQMKQTRELFSETDTSERRTEKRDLQVTDRSSLQREIDRQKEESFNAEASMSARYGSEKGPYSATLSATATVARSSSEAIREAHDDSVETVKSAVSEIEKEVRTIHSERITVEETETNRHEFANAGLVPLVTKYFWVKQERRAQLFSYGKQLIAEFIVPSPARLFEQLLRNRQENEVNRAIKRPKIEKPIEPDKISFTQDQISPENYITYCQKWGIAAPKPPPEATKVIQIPISEGKNYQHRDTVGDFNFDVPVGYEAVSMDLALGPVTWLKQGDAQIDIDCATDTMNWLKRGDSKTFTPLGHLTGSQIVKVMAQYTDYFSMTVSIHLQLLPAGLDEWKKVIFQLIKDKNDAQLSIYNDAINKYEAAMMEYQDRRDKYLEQIIAQNKSHDPMYNRQSERAELKRAVIYLMCQDFSTDGAIIRKAEPCGLPEVNRGSTAAKGYDWYFWDRLIDWKRMAYAFFDYFWNPMCDWSECFDPDEPDDLFKSFKRAGYARVLVPVSPTMHKDFLWYVATHQKWGQSGLPPLNPSDPRWRNVVFEMEHAQDSAMTAREGHADVINGVADVLVKGSDRYWNSAGAGSVDTIVVGLDIDRELFIDGEVYLITGITLDPNSPPYDSLQPNGMWWRLSLDRPYAGPTGIGRLYATGAKAVAPIFSFEMPTSLIWAGAHDACLPSYPLPPC